MNYYPIRPNDVVKGDQIAVKRLCTKLDSPLKHACAAVVGKYYWHHGVYLDNGEVIHFYAVEGKADAKIFKCDINNFPSGCDNKIYRVEHQDTAVLSVDQTLKKARVVWANRTNWRKYDLARYNCETFATWLKTGIERSTQAEKAIRYIGYLLFAGIFIYAISIVKQ